MDTVTTEQADRIATRRATISARQHAEADAAEQRGDLYGAAALRTLADSDRAYSRVRVGARIGRA